MKIISYQKKVRKLFYSNSFFAFFNLTFIFSSYYFLKAKDFSYLTGLFILEGFLIFFELTIFNYIVNKLPKLKKTFEKQKLIFFFLNRILIYSVIFLLFNLFVVKYLYWDKIIEDKIYIFNNISLSLFLSFIVSLIIILRILINYLKVVLIGCFKQELLANIQIASSIIKISILLFFLTFSRTVESVLFSYFIGLILEFSLIFKFFIKTIKFRFIFNLNAPKFPNTLIFFAFSIIVFFNIDRIFLSYNSNLIEISQYNFFRVILSGFFILSVSYYYSLLPDISKFYNMKKTVNNRIYISFKSLNIILIFIISGALLFADIVIYDFKINNFINIHRIVIFKILLIQAYFITIGVILYSFQVSAFFIKIPTLINFILIIISIPLFIFFGNAENATNLAIIYLSLSIGWFFLNLFFLNKFFNKVFSNNLLIFFLKNSFQNFSITISFMIILYIAVYSFSKLIFYLILFFSFLYCIKISQRILSKEYV
jgi:O-antigen/teichoic acid export membrane protein